MAHSIPGCAIFRCVQESIPEILPESTKFVETAHKIGKYMVKKQKVEKDCHVA